MVGRGLRLWVEVAVVGVVEEFWAVQAEAVGVMEMARACGVR